MTVPTDMSSGPVDDNVIGLDKALAVSEASFPIADAPVGGNFLTFGS